MLFNSLTFLVFLAAVLALDRLLPSWRSRKTMLLVASYAFYAAWNPPLVLLLWLSTAVDWFMARRIARSEIPAERRLAMLISVVVNLGLLGYFKYGGFVLENLVSLMAAAGISWTPAAPNIILPVGISFYTFQTMSYTLDVYRRRAQPSGSFLDFALYVTFFPQLVAGPIVRATTFLPQCLEAPIRDARRTGWGLFLLTLGLFQKTVVADVLLAPSADAVFGWAFGPVSTVDAWLGTLAFSGQIFCDFAGYSTCAIGIALCLGFALPDNFRRPYAAIGLRDFWRRWHISLSTWLRDYLYIPLGGSRRGALRTAMALMTTMLLGGLWHGAGWTFVAWGALHGLYLVVERVLAKRFGHQGWVEMLPSRIVLAGVTHVLVLLTWVFFRATDFGQAGLILLTMAGVVRGGPAILPTIDVLTVLVVSVLLWIVHGGLRDRSLEEIAERLPSWVVVAAWAFMMAGLVLAQGGGDAFIYFQF